MAGDQNNKPEQIKKIDIVSDTAQQNADKQAGADKAKEAPDTRVETLTAIQTEAKNEISRSNIAIVASDQKVDDATQKYLNEYFQGSIDRFDKDKDGKISADEAKDFKAKMMEKTKSVIGEIKDAGKKVEKAEKSAAAVEKMKPEDISKTIEGISDLTTGALDLQKGIEEFEKMQKQNTAFQQSVQNQIASINAFGKSFQTFKEDQSGFSFFSYAAKKIFTDKIEQQQAALTQQLESTKAEANKVLADLTAKKAVLDKNGEAIKAAIAAERARIIKERDEKLKEIASAQAEQKEALDEKKKKYKEIEDQQKKLEERKKGVEAKQANVAGIQKTWAETKAAEQWDNKKKDLESSTKDAQAELEAMDILLNEPTLTPEAKEKVKAERAKIAERLKRGELGVKLATERIETGKKIERKLSDEEQSAAQELNSVKGYLDGQLLPAKDSLQKNIANMEELKMQYATEAGQVTEHYNKRVTEVDKISEGVNDYVFTSATSRNKALDALKKSTESLSKITIDSKSLWNPLNWGGALLEGIGGGFMSIAKWIDGNTNSVLKDLGERFKESTSIWGKIGYGLAYGLTQIGGAFAGFVSGGCELIGGVFNMAAHPLESLNGLGTLLGMNVKEGKFFDADTFKAAWSGLGKAVIGYDQFEGEKQNYGGAVGKFAFNVMSLFVGAGEVGAIGKAGEAANLARVAEIDAALAKAGATVGKFEGAAAKLAALEKVDAALAKTTQSAARSAYVKTFAKTVVYESLPQFTKDAAKAGREAIGVGGKTWAVTKSLAGSAVEGVKAVGRGIKAAPRAVASIYGTLLYSPIAVTKGVARMAMNIPKGWKAFRGEGLVNAYRASKMAEAGRTITVESGQYAKARAKIAEIIERDPELYQLSKEGEFGLAAAEGKARIKLMREDPALAASYSKVEEASKALTEHSKKMAESSLESLEKVKNNPELKYEVGEYERLKAQAAEAKATYEQVQGTSPANAPKAKPQVVTEPLAIEKVDAYVERTAKQYGWNAEQKAHMREQMLGSAELKNTPAGNPFARKLQDIAEPYISGAEKFPTKPATPKISEAEAKAQLDSANKALKTFEENPDRMKYVKQNEEAIAAEKNLKATLEEQQKLFQEYTGARNPELAALESEIGEAAARRGETPGRPAIKDTPEVIKANYDNFVDAVKSGDTQRIERARAEFGPRESNTPLGKKLDAVEQIAKETPTDKQARADAIKKYADACKDKANIYSGDLAEMRKQYMDALKKGDTEIIERIKAQKINEPYREALKGIELEFNANPNNLYETYIKHQDGLYNMYRDYNEAWSKGDAAKLSEIRASHPDLAKAFDQLDLRHKVLDKNQAITHDIAAARIKADLITQKFPEGTKAADAADVLARRYSNDKMQLGVSGSAKEITTLELLDDAGKPAKYKVRLEPNGQVILIGEDLKPVVAPKAKPVAAVEGIELELAKTKVKVFEEDLAKAEKDLATAKGKPEYQAAVDRVSKLEDQVKIAKANLEAAKKAPAGPALDVAKPLADEASQISRADLEWNELQTNRKSYASGNFGGETHITINGIKFEIPGKSYTRYSKQGSEIIQLKDGRIILQDGTVRFPDGRIELPNGSVRQADGKFVGAAFRENAYLPSGQPRAIKYVPEKPGLTYSTESWEYVMNDRVRQYMKLYEDAGLKVAQKEMFLEVRRGLSSLPRNATRAEIAEAMEKAAKGFLEKNFTAKEIAEFNSKIASANPGYGFDVAKIATMEADLAKLEGELAAAKASPEATNAAALEAKTADLRKKLADANLEVNKLSAEAKAGTPTPAPTEFVEYQKLRQRKAAADTTLESINSTEHLPRVDRGKVQTAMSDLSLEHLNTALENIGRGEKLTTAELLEVRAKLIESKKLDGLKSTGIADRQDFEKIIRDALRDKAASVRAAERATAAVAEAKAADQALAAFEGDKAKVKVAKDYEAQQAGAPYRAPAEAVKLTPDQVKTLEADIAKAEGELNAAKAIPEYKTAAEKVADLEAKITTIRDQLAEARKAPQRVRIATPGQPAPVSQVAKLEGELATLEGELTKAKAAPEYQKAAQLEGDLAKMQGELAAGRPVEAVAKAAPDKPISMRLREADSAVEAAKVDLLAEQKALRTAKENLRLTEETYIKAKESGRYSDAAINNLKNKVDKAREAVLSSEAKIATLEEVLSASRSEYRSALLLRGGEKVLEKLTSPLRSKWLESIKNKLLALPGVPKDIILGLTGLLSEQARILTVKAFQKLNRGFGKAFRNYVSQLIASDVNADVLRKLLAPVTMEQMILMTQLMKGRMPDAKERDKFSELPLPEKLAVIEDGWQQIEKGGHVGVGDFYNGPEQDYIKEKKNSLAEAVVKFEDQEGLTPDTVIANLDSHFGPAMNDMNKTYEMEYEGITVTVAADGTRSYSGIEDWIADQPKRKLIKNTFADTVKEYGELTPSGLKKANGDKPVDSLDAYKKHLSDQVVAKLAKQLENQEISRNMTIKSKDLTAGGEPVFIAHVNEKGQISVEVHNEWASNSYNAIKARPDKPSKPKGQPSSGQPRPKAAPKPASEINTDAADESKLPPISPSDDVYT